MAGRVNGRPFLFWVAFISLTVVFRYLPAHDTGFLSMKYLFAPIENHLSAV